MNQIRVKTIVDSHVCRKNVFHDQTNDLIFKIFIFN